MKWTTILIIFGFLGLIVGGLFALNKMNIIELPAIFQKGVTEQVWYNSSFAKRINITFNNSASTINLTNFTVLVVLNSTRVNYSLTLDNGEDIRFVDSDESTLLSHEIELWNESGNSYVWVKVPQIDNGSTTDFIQMYYNNQTPVNDGQDFDNTWNDEIPMVYLLSNNTRVGENLTRVYDWTNNGNNGTAYGTLTYGTNTPFGSGISMRANPYLEGRQDFQSNFTLFDTWFERDFASMIITFKTNASNGTFNNGLTDNAGTFPNSMTIRGGVPLGSMEVFFRDSASNTCQIDLATNNIYADNTWHIFIVNRMNNTGLELWADGVLKGTCTTVTGAVAFTQNWILSAGSDSAELNGTMDFFMLKNTNLTQSEVAVYNKTLLQDSFNTYGAEETLDLPPQWSSNSTNSTVAGAFIQHSVNWTDEINLSGYTFSFCNGTY